MVPYRYRMADPQSSASERARARIVFLPSRAHFKEVRVPRIAAQKAQAGVIPCFCRDTYHAQGVASWRFEFYRLSYLLMRWNG